MKLADLTRRNIVALIIVSTSLFGTSYQAVVITPVADLVGAPHAQKILPVEQAFGPAAAQAPACPRLHQLLYNDLVNVHEKKGAYVKVEIPMLFFVTAVNKRPQSQYWTLASNLCPTKDIDTKKLPNPFEWQTKKTPSTKTVVLKYPYHYKGRQLDFSAGTRFVPCLKKSNPKEWSVYYFNNVTKKAELITIPRSYCIPTTDSIAQKRTAFVDLARTWATKLPYKIPYVWGGCSVGKQKKAPLKKKRSVSKKSWYTSITLPEQPTGLDCAGLVARAAQSCSIPYFFKNTTTLATYLSPIKIGELAEGDLIWIPGHVMIVGSPKKNTLIEARTAAHGYGYVHEIPLNKVFKGITTYRQLVAAFQNRSPLVRLNKAGNIIRTYKEFKLLSLASAWDY